jgi:hypothetical protein
MGIRAPDAAQVGAFPGDAKCKQGTHVELLAKLALYAV